jgi:hypothetical protein
MAITFHCTACGARFQVDDQLAGKKARCKKCRQTMEIPAKSGSVEGREPALAGVATSAKASAKGSARSPVQPLPVRPMTWIEAVTSQVALKPITEQNLRPVKQKPSPLDDASFPGLYEMATSQPVLPPVRTGGRPAGAITVAYRQRMLGVQRLFRWLNETASLIAIPFIGLFLFGVVLHNRSLCLLSATVIVLLSITRLVTGLINLVVIPFRDSPIQGVLFLIPPVTFVYLYQNWRRVRKPVERIIGPLLLIGALVLAFSFLPWLRGVESDRDASIAESLREGTSALKDQVRGDLKKAGVTDENLRQYGQKITESAEQLERAARERLDQAAPKRGETPR